MTTTSYQSLDGATSQIVALYCLGLTVREIAERLRCHRRTIDDRLTHAAGALGATTPLGLREIVWTAAGFDAARLAGVIRTMPRQDALAGRPAKRKAA